MKIKIKVESIESVKPLISGMALEINITEDQAQRLFYDIWERYEIDGWIKAEGYKLEPVNNMIKE